MTEPDIPMVCGRDCQKRISETPVRACILDRLDRHIR